VSFVSFAVKFSRVKILFIGDIVGHPGRNAVKTFCPNCGTSTASMSSSPTARIPPAATASRPTSPGNFLIRGVDAITTGDHLWDQKEVMELLQKEKRFLRPLNYPPGTPGRGSTILKIRDLPPVAVMNVQGRTFMQPPLENPFLLALDEVKWLREHTPIIFVDFHAEATSEKIAFARMLDGQVSAVVGTHTHVQTADEQIFPGGTAYLTDAGFTGPHESVLGREIQPVHQKIPHRNAATV
jgi:2',3'-cyclic-nucleotide 2'-phosphodiesterase